MIHAAQVRSVLKTRPLVHAALSDFLYHLSAQALQTVACNRLHSLEARCCRWLLMMQDRTGSDDLPLTQESLATMLGSGRPRINVLLAILELSGLIVAIAAGSGCCRVRRSSGRPVSATAGSGRWRKCCRKSKN